MKVLPFPFAALLRGACFCQSLRVCLLVCQKNYTERGLCNYSPTHCCHSKNKPPGPFPPMATECPGARLPQQKQKPYMKKSPSRKNDSLVGRGKIYPSQMLETFPICLENRLAPISEFKFGSDGFFGVGKLALFGEPAVNQGFRWIFIEVGGMQFGYPGPRDPDEIERFDRQVFVFILGLSEKRNEFDKYA
ncbi:hypothetical protein C8J57DRAFT_1248989 [Mycena rebaudengoi]|nr:hypothetical protein C8J57DRAFT_1248989 [Mycena rebaudengoi]